MTVFSSILAKEMSDFLRLYNNSPYSTRMHFQCFLISLDSFLSDYTAITDAVFQEWTKQISTSDYSQRTKIEKISKTNSFLRYLNMTEYQFKLIPVPKEKKDYLPYIYTDAEIKSIITYLDDMDYCYRTNLKHLKLELPILFRLFIYTGMRKGEALNIKLEDYDETNGTIVLKQTKGMKERFVPLNKELNDIVKLYKNYIIQYSEQYLFPGTTNTNHLGAGSMERFFVNMRKQLGFGPSKKRRHERGACIHCFRHYFTIHAFKKAQDEGHSISESVPYLSYYLGHQEFRRTEEYLKFAPDMFPDETSKFEEYADSIMEDIL